MYKMMWERIGFSKHSSFFLDGCVAGISIFAIMQILSGMIG